MEVAITGLGCISPLGRGFNETWSRALKGRSAITKTKITAPCRASMIELPLATIADEWLSPPERMADPRFFYQLDRLGKFALISAAEALDDASLDSESLLDMAIIVGCACGGQTSLDAAYKEMYVDGQTRLAPLTLPRVMGSSAASAISIAFGGRGPAWCINSACASSSHAIAQGFELVRSGRSKIAIVGGVEASLTYGHLLAWKAIGAVATETCRPFSLGRDGTALGEGGAFLVLEEANQARSRGANIYGSVRSSAASADAFHITRPNIRGPISAMRSALNEAAIRSMNNWLIISHGTGTTANDSMEAAALHKVFGSALANVRVSATKSLHGHLLGASAALELVLGLFAMRAEACPPLANYLSLDPNCDLPLHAEIKGCSAILANSFAFGGLNSAIVIEKC